MRPAGGGTRQTGYGTACFLPVVMKEGRLSRTWVRIFFLSYSLLQCMHNPHIYDLSSLRCGSVAVRGNGVVDSLSVSLRI